MVGGRVAPSQSLAFARIADGHVVRWRPSHGNHMAPCGRGERRLSRLLLLPYLCGTQKRIDCNSTGGTSAVHLVPAKASAVGNRRFAHQAVRAQGRRGRFPSQPDAGPSRPAVSVRTPTTAARRCPGDDFVGAEAPRVGPTGVAAASDALCSQADHGGNPQVASLAAIRHQTSTGGAAGRVDRSDPETSGKNGLDRDRRRLHQAAWEPIRARKQEAGSRSRESGDKRQLFAETALQLVSAYRAPALRRTSSGTWRTNSLTHLRVVLVFAV